MGEAARPGERGPVGWVRIDDSFYDHPKFVNLSMESVGLWVSLLAWSNRNLTDGQVPAKVADRFGVDPAELVAAGLVEQDLIHLTIVNYGDYQPTAAEIRERSDKRRAAGRKGAANRWQTDSNDDGNEMANAMATPRQTDGPNPNPIIASRRRDETFDAIVEVCGIDASAITASAGAMIGKVRKSLTAAGATPESIRQVADAYRRTYPTMSLTPTALDKHYPALVGSTPTVPTVAGTTLGRAVDAAPSWVLDEDGVARPFRAPERGLEATGPVIVESAPPDSLLAF